MDTKNVELIKRELQRRANDRLKVYNPTDKDFEVIYDGITHIARAKSDTVFPRYIAKNYLTKMTDFLINKENDERVIRENKRRTKTGQKEMDPQERERFDLRTSDKNLRRSYMSMLYKGVVERYGIQKATDKDQIKPTKPIDEELLEELETTQTVEEPVIETIESKDEFAEAISAPDSEGTPKAKK